MKQVKRLVAFALSMCMLLALMPAPAQAAAVERIPHRDPITVVNPLFAEAGVPEFPAVEESLPPLSTDSSDYTTDTAEAGRILREGLVARTDTITVPYLVPEDADASALIGEIWDEAVAHTGVPVEGDYLSRQWGGYRVSFSSVLLDGSWYFLPTWSMNYKTTAQQEAEMDVAVEALLTELDLEGKTRYEQFSAVYLWMCENITYDYENLEDSSYTLKYTAYAALINKNCGVPGLCGAAVPADAGTGY